jgi:UDP-glucose 4-epimerase
MSSVLVSGATGFIGKRVVDALLREGFEVYALSRSLDNATNLHVHYIEYDFLSPLKFQLPETVTSVTTFIDLASVIPGAQSFATDEEEKQSLMEQNALGHMTLVEKLPQLKKIIYTSTVDVYGPSQHQPYTEAHETNPATVYASSKLYLETLYSKWAKEEGKVCVTLRLSQVYGPGDSMRKVIPRFFAAIREEKGIELVDEGKAKRRFVFVDDVVAAVLLALRYEKSDTFNVAGEEISSIKDVVTVIEEKLGEKAHVSHIAGKADQCVMDISKAERELGYHPKVSLKEGISKLL